MNNGITVVGAGFTGATAARILAEFGYRVFLFEERGTVGGNAADTPFTHLYGPHIFHTNSEKVERFLGQFTTWRPYEHRVRALVDGVGPVPLPVNFSTLEALYGQVAGGSIGDRLCETFGRGSSVPIGRLRLHENGFIKALGEDLFSTFFEGYTAKMWDAHPDDLSPGVTARVPIRLSRDDRYFTDEFQAQPGDGYLALFERMLDHPNIELHLNDRYLTGDIDGRVIYTGAVDSLLEYSHGVLPYRSMRFETVKNGGALTSVGGAATLNYPSPDCAFTRETEMGIVTGSGVSLVVREYPQTFLIGENDRYYPIPMEQNREMWRDYEQEAAKRGIVLAGRLAEYKYYNMDQAVAAGMKAAEKITGVKI